MKSAVAILSASIVLWAGPAAADCTSDVTAAFEKLRTSKSFRLETRIANAQGKLKMTVDYMPPDRMHQRIRLDDQPQEMEMIVIGEKAWSNQGQGWVPLPENFSSEVAKQVKTTLAGITQSQSSYRCKSEDTIEGRAVAIYEADLVAPVEEAVGDKPGGAKKPEGPPNLQTLYIDKATGLPLRNVVTDAKDPSKQLYDGWFRTAEAVSINPPNDVR